MRQPSTFQTILHGLGAESCYNDTIAAATAQAQPEVAPSLRRKALWAHALVLLHVWGIPLSYGAYFEYYFNTQFPTKPLSSVAIPIALQLLCILGMPSLVGSLYHALGTQQEWWRLIFVIAGLTATATQFALQWCTQYTSVVILQGAVLGSALGTLWTVSILVLASHYKGDVPLVSTFCGFAGFVGAILHTLIARWGLSMQKDEQTGYAQIASGAFLFGTLLISLLLMRRVKEHALSPWSRCFQLRLKLPSKFVKDLWKSSTVLFLLGYIAIFLGIFTYPAYLVLLLTQPPTLFAPKTGTVGLLIMLSTASLSACLSANAHTRRRIGAVNTFAFASILAGAAALAPVRMPKAYVSFQLAAAYGLALGCFVPLNVVVTALFMGYQPPEKGKARQDDIPARVAFVMVLAGICTFTAIMASSVLVENLEKGLDVVLRITGGLLIGGGVVILGARLVKWEGVWYAV